MVAFVVAIVAVSCLMGPRLLGLCGLYFVRNGLIRDQLDLYFEEKSKSYYVKWYELCRLGFQPIGLHWERIALWLKGQQYVLCHRKCPCTATIDAKSYHLELWTVFECNYVLVTVDYDRKDVVSDEVSIISMPGASVESVFGEQQRRIAMCVSDGRIATQCAATDFAQMAKTFYATKTARRMFQQISLKYLMWRGASLLLIYKCAIIVGGEFNVFAWWAVAMMCLLMIWHDSRR